jgi:hypothetical protein
VSSEQSSFPKDDRVLWKEGRYELSPLSLQLQWQKGQGGEIGAITVKGARVRIGINIVEKGHSSLQQEQG